VGWHDSQSVTALRTLFSTSDSTTDQLSGISIFMIRKLKSGEFRLYSRKKDASTGKRRNLGTFDSLDKAKQHEREVQYFKRH
jgi:hypothetical protein